MRSACIYKCYIALCILFSTIYEYITGRINLADIYNYFIFHDFLTFRLLEIMDISYDNFTERVLPFVDSVCQQV